MSLYDESIPQVRKMLTNLSGWTDQAMAFAEERSFDASVLANTRLSPDMFPFTRQVQSACDAAKFLGARLSGVEAPSHPDTETTLPELKARIEETVAYLDGVDKDAFSAGGDRELFLSFLQGGSVMGVDYLRDFAVPNFYFHVTMAYAILRHSGVALGKRAYIGNMKIKPPPAT